jgi:hypothetical protein
MVPLDLKPGETRETTDPVVSLELPAGEYLLTLVVVGADKKESQPVTLSVIVKKTS